MLRVKNFILSKGFEFTVEANPGTVNKALLKNGAISISNHVFLWDYS